MAQDELFYVAQKAVIEKDGKVLLLYDPDISPDLPGGKIQIGEKDFTKSLKREVIEETGLEIKVCEPFFTDYIEFPKNIKHRHAGKKIFVVFFKAKYISGEVTLSDEHNEYRWVTRDSYKTIKAFDKRYNDILNALEVYFGSS